ncbi:MAG: hypothetical protein PHN82_05460 [bacterium]|nr:hypothetical protein [bacterium]
MKTPPHTATGPLADPLPPEEIVERRLERVRRRANLLRLEAAVSDIAAVSLGALFVGYVLARLDRLSPAAAAALVAVPVCGAVFRLLRARRRWTGRGAAAALIDGEMNLKQRLVTFREYAAHPVKPRLYERLARDIVSELDDSRIRAILPHRVPPSAFAALAVILALILDLSIGTTGLRDETAPPGEEQMALAEEEDEPGVPTPTPERERAGAEPEPERYKDSRQMAKMRQELLQTIQGISQELDRLGGEGAAEPAGTRGGADASDEGSAGEREGDSAERRQGDAANGERAAEAEKGRGGESAAEGAATGESGDAASGDPDPGRGERSDEGLRAGEMSPGGGGSLGSLSAGAGGEPSGEEQAGGGAGAASAGAAAGDEGKRGSGDTAGGAAASAGAAAGEKAAGEKAAGERAAGEPGAGEKTAGDMAAGERAAGEPRAGEKAAGEGASGVAAAGEKAAGDMAAGERAAGERGAGEKAAGEKAAGERAAGETGAGEKAAGEGASSGAAAGEKAVGEKTAGDMAKGGEVGAERGEKTGESDRGTAGMPDKASGSRPGSRESGMEHGEAAIPVPQAGAGDAGTMRQGGSTAGEASAEEAAAREGGDAATEDAASGDAGKGREGETAKETDGKPEKGETADLKTAPAPGGGMHDPRTAPAPIEPPAGMTEKVYIKLTGEEETGRPTRRLTLSPSDGGEGAADRRPVTAVDPDARLSAEQAGEDAVGRIPVPPEYRHIIRNLNAGGAE